MTLDEWTARATSYLCAEAAATVASDTRNRVKRMMAAGHTEAEAVASLGKPREALRRYARTYINRGDEALLSSPWIAEYRTTKAKAARRYTAFVFAPAAIGAMVLVFWANVAPDSYQLALSIGGYALLIIALFTGLRITGSAVALHIQIRIVDHLPSAAALVGSVFTPVIAGFLIGWLVIALMAPLAFLVPAIPFMQMVFVFAVLQVCAAILLLGWGRPTYRKLLANPTVAARIAAQLRSASAQSWEETADA